MRPPVTVVRPRADSSSGTVRRVSSLLEDAARTQPGQRINRPAADVDLQMKVRSGGVPSVARVGNDLACGHPGAGRDQLPRQVCVDGTSAVTHIDRHPQALPAVPSGGSHHAVVECSHRRTDGCGEVVTLVIRRTDTTG